ncbi:hypothetical protein [Mammaliicoccus vitulinus]|uniref:hypothetical protein n=1 Tax=Mammaliicoccus vitulinus TaxID=71237 RepID=UPI00248C6B65|nr:hypothetical protein [Mammaliicoccus vitulinus]
MISKVINSYDIQVNGQLLRVVEAREISVEIKSYNNKLLLMNEPRGNKYVNLLVYQIDYNKNFIKVTLDSPDIINNQEILLKIFINSLIDRKIIEEKEIYTLVLNDETLEYANDELAQQTLFKVLQDKGGYKVNSKGLQLVETDLNFEVNNLTEIKTFIESIKHTQDYLVLYNAGKFITVNKSNTIIPYPVLEVISMLSEVYKKQRFTTLLDCNVEIHNNNINYQYYLISNSQFYIDDTDIYESGFIIK